MKNRIALLSVLVLSSLAMAEDLMTVKDFLKEGLAGAPKLAKETFPLSDAQKKELAGLAPKATEGDFTFYFGRGADGKLQRACTVVPQAGKEGPMTVGVCFDPSGVIKIVHVLAYMEERGKPVKEQAFLGQFAGKPATNAFKLGKDVDGISGATYSSTAVAEAVRKSSFAYRNFVAGK